MARQLKPTSTLDPSGREQVFGQAQAIDSLRRALERDRFASSWIFHGPEGVGKRTTALRLARILLEGNLPPEAIASGASLPDSATQTLIDARTHPDLVVLSKDMAAESQIPRLREKKQVDIPADLLREHIIGGVIKGENRIFEPAVHLSPSKAPRRVFIIDEAELLNPTGQNALLKTLEEPPPTSVIILLTTNPARMLPTVRSRCQTLAFRRLSEDGIGEWMRGSGTEAGPPELAFAEGSPGRVLFALRHDVAAWRARLEPGLADLAIGRYPVAFAPLLAEVIDDFAKAREKENRRTSLEAAKREGLGVVLGLIARFLQERMHAAIAEGERDAAEVVARSLDHLVEAEDRIARSLNLKMVLADMVAKLAETLAAEGVMGA